MVERLNRTLVNILVTMLEPERHQKDWVKYLPMVTAAYRSTVHDMMMFGREVTLPKERKKQSLQTRLMVQLTRLLSQMMRKTSKQTSKKHTGELLQQPLKKCLIFLQLI